MIIVTVAVVAATRLLFDFVGKIFLQQICCRRLYQLQLRVQMLYTRCTEIQYYIHYILTGCIIISQ